MTDFITLNMFIEQKKSRDARYHPEPPAPPFLDWKAGYVVRSKTNSNGEHFTINLVDGSTELGNYHRIFHLENADGESRVVKGSTLQSGYAYVSGAPAPEPEKDTQPLVVNVDAIREFYPRKEHRPGSRVGIGIGTRSFYIVQESTEEIVAAVLAVLQGDQVVTNVLGSIVPEPLSYVHDTDEPGG
jgi:hypothetical protein